MKGDYARAIEASNSKLWLLQELLVEQGIPASTLREFIEEVISRCELDRMDSRLLDGDDLGDIIGH